MKKAFIPLFILVPLLIALCLRLYPTIITGMPFSTDGWPIIKNTQLLLSHTPVPLSSKIFDGYDNYMPANSLFAAILSEVTSIAPINIMALGIPIVGALAIPIFYVLVNKVTRNSKISLIASILLATAFPYALFTAGVTKETFASPIYMSLILLFLLKHNWKTTLLYTTVSIALVLSHQATTFLTIVVLSTLTVGLYVSKGDKEQNVNSNKSNILFVGILSTAAALYFGLYATPAIILTFTPSDLLTVGAYVVLATGTIVYLIHRNVKPTQKRTMLKCTVSFLAPAVIMFLITKIPMLPGAPILPLHYFVYAVPFLITTPLIIYGLNDLNKNNFPLIVPLFWLTAVLSLAIYTVFGNVPGGEGFVYRFLNFMLPPMAILTAIALYKVYTSKTLHFETRKISKFSAIALIAVITVTSTFSLYAAVSLQEPYLGYFWSYKPSEYAASDWIALNGNNQTITGDVKTQCLLNGYFKVNVNVLPGLNFLDGASSEPSLLYVYNQMKTNGYVLYEGSPVSLPANWISKLANYNVVYANSEVTIYAEG